MIYSSFQTVSSHVLNSPAHLIVHVSSLWKLRHGNVRELCRCLQTRISCIWWTYIYIYIYMNEYLWREVVWELLPPRRRRVRRMFQRYRTRQKKSNDAPSVPLTREHFWKHINPMWINWSVLWGRMCTASRLHLKARSARGKTTKKYCVTYVAGSAAWTQTGTNWRCSSWRRSSEAGPSPSN